MTTRKIVDRRVPTASNAKRQQTDQEGFADGYSTSTPVFAANCVYSWPINHTPLSNEFDAEVPNTNVYEHWQRGRTGQWGNAFAAKTRVDVPSLVWIRLDTMNAENTPSFCETMHVSSLGIGFRNLAHLHLLPRCQKRVPPHHT